MVLAMRTADFHDYQEKEKEMKKLSLLLVVFMLFGASFVNAELPNTFSAGTPAKASEVNANFQNLDGRIKSLEEKFDGGDSDPYPHKLTYTYIASTPGKEITIGGQTYRIIRMPIKTPDGKVYALTLPSAINESTSSYYADSPYFIRSSVTVQHNYFDIFSDFTINGYTATSTVSDYWSYTAEGYSSSNEGKQGYWDQSYGVHYSPSLSISIQVNDCLISAYFSFSEQQVAQSDIPNTVSDFTGVDMTSVGDNMTMIEHLDKLLDYIYFELLP